MASAQQNDLLDRASQKTEHPPQHQNTPKQETTESTEIAKQQTSLVPAARRKEIRHLSAVAKQARSELAECADDIEKAFTMASALRAIRDAITPGMMSDILSFANDPNGFKTDRRPGAVNKKGEQLKPYPDIVYKDVITQALIRGLHLIGNEFNIIAGNLYVTKEGVKRLIDEFPGVTGFQWDIGVPKKHGDGSLVSARAWWYRDGKRIDLVCEGDYVIPVRSNDGMGIDAVLGKAESKLWRRCYNRMVGTKDLQIAEDEDDDVIEGEVVETAGAEKTTES